MSRPAKNAPTTWRTALATVVANQETTPHRGFAAVAAVEDARGDLALLARAAVDRVEAGAQLGHRLADQLAGAVDLGARTLDLGADEVAQLLQQPALVAQQRGVGRPARGPREPQPGQGHGGQGTPAHRRGEVQRLGHHQDQGERQRRCETKQNTRIHCRSCRDGGLDGLPR